MAVLEIKKYPDPILRKKAEEIKEITEETRRLSLNMIETMTENEGIGISAPQVGKLKRIIAAHLIKDRSSEAKFEIEPQVFINPMIINKSKETETDEEGCLSFPSLFLKIKRAKEVEIETLDISGKKIQIKAEGLAARALQHEIDHLDGILFIDKIGFWKKLFLKRKLKTWL